MKSTKQVAQRASQIDEEAEIDQFADEDMQEVRESELSQNNNILKKSNKQLKKDLEQCKLEAGQRAVPVAPKQPQRQQGMAQQSQERVEKCLFDGLTG